MECSRCGKENPDTANFCLQCGTQLRGETDAAASRPSLESHFARVIATRASLASDLAVAPPEDATRLLTILFADMSGSVQTTFDLDPEETADFLNRVLTAMVEVIREQDGRISRFLGDGVVAYFGTPSAQENDAERAILAALGIRARLQAMGLNGTAGINTGEVYLGRVGSAQHQEFSAQGKVINLAARLQSSAEPGEVLVGETTYQLTRNAFEFTQRSISLKGVSEPVRVYSVKGSTDLHRKARGIEGLHANMLGRDAELSELQTALAELVRGESGIVAVIGDAGVGKTRLVDDFKERAGQVAEKDAKLLWVEGRCLATGAGITYLPYLDLFRSMFRLQFGTSERERVGGIGSFLETLVQAGYLEGNRASEISILLCKMLSIPLPAADAKRLESFSAEQLKNQTFRAVRDFLVSQTRAQPLVMVLEDVHWIDPLSLELTLHLLDALPEARLLLLCLSRPEPEYKWRRLDAIASEKCEKRYRCLKLTELDNNQSQGLLRELLGAGSIPDGLERAILSRAQGNPFFLEEVIRSFIDAGVLALSNGRLTARGELDRLSVPESVQAIILSRVDRLPEAERQILQLASVVGRTFRRGLLANLWTDLDQLEAGLWNLERRELIFIDRVVPEEEYSFKHVLTQETIYRSLVRVRRTDFHQRIGKAIEQLYADTLEEHYEALAHHYERAAEPDKCLEYLVLAGEKSRSAFANEAALDSFQRALTLLESTVERQGVTSEIYELRARLHESVGDVLELSGRHEDAITAFRRGLEFLSVSHAIASGRLYRKIGKCLQVQRKTEQAFEAFDQAVKALGETPAADDQRWWQERSEIELARALLAYFAAPLPRLAELLASAEQFVAVHGTAAQRSNFFHLQALASLRRNSYVADEETVEVARIAAESSGDVNPAEAGMTQFIYGFSLLWANRLNDAERQLTQTYERAVSVGDVTLQSRCLTYLTLVHRKRGETERVASLAGRSLQVGEAGGMTEYLAQANANLAWVAGRVGNLHEWGQRSRAAIQLWKLLPAPGPYVSMAWIAEWPALGFAIQQGHLEEALAYTRSLLDPDRQPMPQDLSQSLSSALNSTEPEVALAQLGNSVQLARLHGYL